MAVVAYALVYSLFVAVIILHKTKQWKGLRVLELNSACQQTKLPLRHKHTGYRIWNWLYILRKITILTKETKNMSEEKDGPKHMPKLVM